MKRFINFIIRIVRGFNRHDLLAYSYSMTYRLVISFFPMIIFALSIISFLQIDELAVTEFLESVRGVLPPPVMEVVDTFVEEVVDTRSTAVMSSTLAVTLFTASSGFISVIKGINKTYGHKDTRNWVLRRALSILLALLFVVIVALAMTFMVFSRNIQNLIYRHFDPNPLLTSAFGLVGYLLSVFIILFVIVMIFKIGNCKKVKILDLLPGACVTVVFWILFSWIFNIYLATFAAFNVIYGSLFGIVVFLLYLNFITTFLLVGSEINAILSEGYIDGAGKEKEIGKKVLQ